MYSRPSSFAASLTNDQVCVELGHIDNVLHGGQETPLWHAAQSTA